MLYLGMEELMVQMILDGWQGQLKATDKLFEKLTDEELMHEVAPGRNRGIYLLGHLTAVHDMMLPLLRLGESVYPELQPAFISAPDKTVAALPAVATLRTQWHEVNNILSAAMNSLPAGEWLTRHGNVSEEDFAKEPHRNRLNVLLSRTSHLANHRGQLTFLLPVKA